MMYRTLEASEFFDRSWYRATQLSALERLSDPIWHYLDHGWKKGLNPSPHFDTTYYLSHNPDVKELGLNPLYHYLAYGVAEQRHPVATTLQALERHLGPASGLTVITVPGATPSRISVVIDDHTSRDSGLPYTRVIAAAASIASASTSRMRIIDRRCVPSDLRVRDALSLSAVNLPHGFEHEITGVRNPGRDLPILDDERFLATSWSSLQSLVNTVSSDRVHYLATDEESRLLADTDAADSFSTVRGNLHGRIIDAGPLTQPAKGSGKSRSLVNFSPAWSGKASGKPGTTVRIAVDLDPRASGARIAGTLEFLQLAYERGVLNPRSHEIIALSPDQPAISVLASANPRFVDIRNQRQLSAEASAFDVFITLARPVSLGLVELAVAARGGVVITRYAAHHLSPGRIVSTSASAADVVKALTDSMPTAPIPARHQTFHLAIDSPVSL